MSPTAGHFALLGGLYQPFSIPRTGEKVPGGEIGGAAGARISRPIIVIRLESKLINKIKATGSGALFLVFIEYCQAQFQFSSSQQFS